MTDKSREPGTVHRQKARKERPCAECASPILKGDVYIYLNTFDERAWPQWSKYVLCLGCERILNCYRVAGVALGEDSSYAAGHLRLEVKGVLMASPEWKREFNKAWEASATVDVLTEDA